MAAAKEPQPLDFTFTAPICKDGASGTGPHWLPLRAALCKAIGKSNAGEQVSVHLQQRLS